MASYNTPGEQIVHDSVQTVREGGDTTVNGFTEKVKEEVRRRTTALQEQVGDAAKDIAGDAMQKAESYAEAKNRIFDPNFNVGDAASKGAAAFADMNKREVTVDGDGMDLHADEGYWNRVRKHEEVHIKDQAADFNRTELSYVDASDQVQTIEVVGSMTEGQATQVNENGDLTPEYADFKQDWNELTAVVDEGIVADAMKTGDIQGLQDRITQDAIERENGEGAREGEIEHALAV